MVTTSSIALVVLAVLGSAQAQFCTATKTVTIYPPCAVRPCTTCVTIVPRAAEPEPAPAPDITISAIGLGSLSVVTDKFPTACPYTKTVTTFAMCPTATCIPVICPYKRNEFKTKTKKTKSSPIPTSTPPPSSTPAATTSFVKPSMTLPHICPTATLLRPVPCPLIMCPMETDVICALDQPEAAEILAESEAELAAAGLKPAIQARQDDPIDLTITKTITTIIPKTCTGGITITGKFPCPTRCPPRCTVFATETVYV